MYWPLTHLELRQRVSSSLPRTLVVSGHAICQGRLEANAKGGLGASRKLFSEYQRGALIANIELRLNRRELCTLVGDKSRWAEAQLGGRIEGDNLSRSHDVEAGSG